MKREGERVLCTLSLPPRKKPSDSDKSALCTLSFCAALSCRVDAAAAVNLL